MLVRSLPGEAQIVVNVCCAFPKESSPPVLTTAPRYCIPPRAGVSRQTPDTAALDEKRDPFELADPLALYATSGRLGALPTTGVLAPPRCSTRSGISTSPPPCRQTPDVAHAEAGE